MCLGEGEELSHLKVGLFPVGEGEELSHLKVGLFLLGEGEELSHLKVGLFPTDGWIISGGNYRS